MVVLALSWCASAYRYKKLPFSLKIFSHLLLLTLLAETTANFVAIKYHNNMTVYSLYNPVQLFFTCWYFNQSIAILRKHNIGILGILAGIADIIFLEPFGQSNKNFLFFEGVVIISLSLLSFARMMLERRDLMRNPHFWMGIILSFFWTISFCNQGLYNYLMVRFPKYVGIAGYSILVVGLITYGSFALMFLLYPKLRHDHE